MHIEPAEALTSGSNSEWQTWKCIIRLRTDVARTKSAPAWPAQNPHRRGPHKIRTGVARIKSARTLFAQNPHWRNGGFSNPHNAVCEYGLEEDTTNHWLKR